MVDNVAYTYEIIDNESDARLCAELLAEAFAMHNPMAVFHQMSAQQYYDEFMWPILKEVYDERLSFLARYRPSGEIVGAIVADDMYSHNQKHPYDPISGPQRVALSDLMQEMQDLFIRRDFGQELKPQMVLHISVGGTRASHSSKGVATGLRKALCAHARDKRGFQYAFVQVNNEATRHIYLNKLGGKEVTKIDPSTWLWKKKGDGLSCPYRGYKDGPIPNILVDLVHNENI
ncbi:unnamed protein product [Rotaria sordida]|uniref:N-acetyltransferase domain-containing protein n=1 Tax=Rotaria sordida TaxID=392033 RepID=A0A819I2H5_9BILA|nr:unnamed protein product [Rotaria sordida]CAF3911983.1 unnamed protein product [Rotaria sordida]CAF3993573.1 unnamed protein product [Rotaria sordida]